MIDDLAPFTTTTAMLAETIGLIGGGQMARALAAGWVRAGLLKPGQLVVHDPSAAAIAQFKTDVSGIQVASDNAAVLKTAKIVIVAVKPQVLAGALGTLAGSAGASPSHTPAAVDAARSQESNGPLLISIAAGWTLARLREVLPGARWVRVMPNTPCLVGESASAFAAGPDITDREKKQVMELLTSVGRAWELPEHLLDAVTGLSGSGPAYAFLMIEALSDGGVRMGLPRDVATALAAQTLRGAATMVLSSGEHPGVLKDRVASPGGTTIAGLYELESHGLRGALISAVTAATERSRELAKG
jgi:pyrroline-5-carboxylate reductase